MEQAGRAERIDYRSNAARGMAEQPTIHEGVVARALEKKGVVSNRCELNRQIKADNALLRELKAEIKKLMETVQNTIPILAEKLESLRQNILIFSYQLNYIRTGKSATMKRLEALKPELAQYTRLVKQIRENSKERKWLIVEKKNTLAFNLPKLHDLTQRISEATELLEELCTKKTMLLRSLEYPEDDGEKILRKSIPDTGAGLSKLKDQKRKYVAAIDDAMHQYKALTGQAANLNAAELLEAQQAIRPEKERIALRKLQDTYGNKYSPMTLKAARKEVSQLLSEDTDKRSIKHTLIQDYLQPIQQKTKESER